jgi:hypothetical protein
VQTEESRQHRFVAIDRLSKAAFAELHPRAKRVVETEFLRRIYDQLPDKVHPDLTDNGVQFTLSRTNFCRVGTVLTASVGNTAWSGVYPNRRTRGATARSSA